MYSKCPHAVSSSPASLLCYGHALINEPLGCILQLTDRNAFNLLNDRLSNVHASWKKTVSIHRGTIILAIY